MKLEHKFNGRVNGELYYTYMRERITTTFYVMCMHKVLLILNNGDLYWKAEYLEDEDAYAITNNWCKNGECWSFRDKTQYAQRFKIFELNEEDVLAQKIENMAD